MRGFLELELENLEQSHPGVVLSTSLGCRSTCLYANRPFSQCSSLSPNSTAIFCSSLRNHRFASFSFDRQYFLLPVVMNGLDSTSIPRFYQPVSPIWFDQEDSCIVKEPFRQIQIFLEIRKKVPFLTLGRLDKSSFTAKRLEFDIVGLQDAAHQKKKYRY